MVVDEWRRSGSFINSGTPGDSEPIEGNTSVCKEPRTAGSHPQQFQMTDLDMTLPLTKWLILDQCDQAHLSQSCPGEFKWCRSCCFTASSSNRSIFNSRSLTDHEPVLGSTEPAGK